MLPGNLVPIVSPVSSSDRMSTTMTGLSRVVQKSGSAGRFSPFSSSSTRAMNFGLLCTIIELCSKRLSLLRPFDVLFCYERRLFNSRPRDISSNSSWGRCNDAWLEPLVDFLVHINFWELELSSSTSFVVWQRRERMVLQLFFLTRRPLDAVKGRLFLLLLFCSLSMYKILHWLKYLLGVRYWVGCAGYHKLFLFNFCSLRIVLF